MLFIYILFSVLLCEILTVVLVLVVELKVEVGHGVASVSNNNNHCGYVHYELVLILASLGFLD